MMKDTSQTSEVGETFDSSSRSVKETDLFDPFGLGAAALGVFEETVEGNDADSVGSPIPPPQLKRIGMSESPPIKKSVPSRRSSSLPPKMVIKLGLHEEVSSVAKHDSEGASDVSVEGTLYAQVQSSDALKNVPFLLSGTNSQGESVLFQGRNSAIVSVQVAPNASPSHPQHLVHIDKSVLNSIAIGIFSFSEEVHHMPLLVERKISVHGNVCRVAVQVRSKLTNLGDLEDITIAVAVPERVNGGTVKVVHGHGVWDELKRTIKWKVDKLQKGSSFMIAAQAELWSPLAASEKHTITFPVLLRCSSSCDQVSSVDFQAYEAEGHPASISCSCIYSFRLLHRLT